MAHLLLSTGEALSCWEVSSHTSLHVPHLPLTQFLWVCVMCVLCVLCVCVCYVCYVCVCVMCVMCVKLHKSLQPQYYECSAGWEKILE